MRYFITTHTIQGKNSLQQAIIDEVERWRGTLIDSRCSMDDCIVYFKRLLNQLNNLKKCRPCQISKNNGSISFSTYPSDDTFAILTFHKVKYTYDGIIKEKEGDEP